MPDSTVQEILERRERTKSPEFTGLGSGSPIDRSGEYANALKIIAEAEKKYGSAGFVGLEDWSQGGRKLTASDLEMGSQGYLVQKPNANHLNYHGPDEKAEHAKDIGKAIHHALRNGDEIGLERAIQKFSRLDDLVDREFAGKQMLRGIYLELVGQNNPLVTQSLDQMSTTELLERLSGQLTEAKRTGKTLIGLDREKVSTAVKNARENKDTPMGEALELIVNKSFDATPEEARAIGKDLLQVIRSEDKIAIDRAIRQFNRLIEADDRELAGNQFLKGLHLELLGKKDPATIAAVEKFSHAELLEKLSMQLAEAHKSGKILPGLNLEKVATAVNAAKTNLNAPMGEALGAILRGTGYSAANSIQKSPAYNELIAEVRNLLKDPKAGEERQNTDKLLGTLRDVIERGKYSEFTARFKAANERENAELLATARKGIKSAESNLELARSGLANKTQYLVKVQEDLKAAEEAHKATPTPELKAKLEQVEKDKGVAEEDVKNAREELATKQKVHALAQENQTKQQGNLYPSVSFDLYVEQKLGASAANALRQVTNITAPSVDIIVQSRELEQLLAAPKSPENTAQLKKFLQHHRVPNMAIILSTIEEASPRTIKELDLKLKDKFDPADYRAAKEILRPGGADLWEKRDSLIAAPLNQAATLRGLTVEQNLLVRDLYAASEKAADPKTKAKTLAEYLNAAFKTKISDLKTTADAALVALDKLRATGTEDPAALAKYLAAASELSIATQTRDRLMASYYKPEAEKIAAALGTAGDSKATTEAVLEVIVPLKGDATYIEEAYDLYRGTKDTFQAELNRHVGEATLEHMRIALALNNISPNAAKDLAEELTAKEPKLDSAIRRLLDLTPKARRILIKATELTIGGDADLITVVQDKKSTPELTDSFFAAMHGLDARTAATEIAKQTKDALDKEATMSSAEYNDYLLNNMHKALLVLPLHAIMMEEELKALGSDVNKPSDSHLEQITFAMDAQLRVVMAKNPKLQDQLVDDFAAISVDLERTISSQAANVWYYWESILKKSEMDTDSRKAGSEPTEISTDDQKALLTALETYLEEAPAVTRAETLKSLEKVYQSRGFDLEASIDAHFSDESTREQVKILLALPVSK